MSKKPYRKPASSYANRDIVNALHETWNAWEDSVSYSDEPTSELLIGLVAGAIATGQLENLIAAGTPGGIEAQEKRGQADQARRETLPGAMAGCTKADFEKLGFVFGGVTDKIFWEVKFPPGWRKEPTDHSMWSNLLDDKGRKRGSIFFKAAFYDYDAHVRLDSRYVVRSIRLDANGEEIFDAKTGDYLPGRGQCQSVFTRQVAMDSVTQEILFATIPVKNADWSRRDEAMERVRQSEAATEACKAWLNDQFPKWQTFQAYWD